MLDLGCGSGLPTLRELSRRGYSVTGLDISSVHIVRARMLVPRLRRWLTGDGYLLAIVGASRWTGVEHYMGAEMFWDHEAPAVYLSWLRDAGLEPAWHRFVPEGDSGHTLILARAS